ncbi:MAG: GNAT family N-acetyltransferase [Pseudomonadota bacterium]
MTNGIEVTITYLRQKERPAKTIPHPPRPGAAILKASRIPVHYYRYLYDLIGGPYNWVSRRVMDDDALSGIIHDEQVFIYILYIDGAPGGFCELDFRETPRMDLKFFGLAPDAIGKGWGGYFLGQCLSIAWDLAPTEIHLETCTLDHRAALPLYQKFGFEAFDMQKGHVDIVEGSNAY